MRTLLVGLFAFVACASDRAAAPKDSAPAPAAVSTAAAPAGQVELAPVVAALSTPATAGMQYPPTRRADAADVLHGVQVPDPYRWLEDEKSPEVQAWMAAQDKFARAYLRGLPGRDAIARRLSELLYVDELGAPRHRGTRYFYSRRLATKEKAIVYVKDR